MRLIAKVIESMLSKDATQQWTGQTSAVASRDTWSWGRLLGVAGDHLLAPRYSFEPRVG